MLNGTGKLICTEARIETCSICNGACTICPREKMTRPKVVMDLDFFKNIVDQCIDLGVTDVALFGFGEPLLDQTLSQKVRYCRRKGLATHITTNGSMLSIEKSHNLLKAGLDHMRFSIHALNPAKYMKVHKNLDWLDVYRNVANFLVLNKKIYAHNCVTHLSVIPMHGETVEEIREVWEDKFDYLEIWEPHGWAGAKNYRGLTKTRRTTCGRPFSGPLQIQADGKVIPCCFITNAEIVLGDTNEKSIREILEDAPYRKLQKAHRRGLFAPYPPCGTCDQRNVEEGGILLYSNRDSERITDRLSTSKCKVST